MRIVIAPDSFKECATSTDVCNAIEAGLLRVFPDAELIKVPMADGGEGTVDALVAATGGKLIEVEVRGPLTGGGAGPTRARYGMLGDGVTAAIEMAAASGLPLVAPADRDPARTTTYGTGELIRHAVEHGAKRIVVGLGGSATNDGGAGMAQALGYSLRDEDGRELPPGGLALRSLASVHPHGPPPLFDGTEVTAACDVDNLLSGPRGTSLIYGPQKGASPELARQLDEALEHFGNVVEAQLNVKVHGVPGAGAAGGLGAGILAFLGGSLRAGVEVVAEACGLAQKIKGADLVITGEGRLDAQSAYGKTPVGVARLAKRYGVPAVALVGALGEGFEDTYKEGIEAVFPVIDAPCELSAAMANAPGLIADRAEALARLWRAARGQQ